MTTKYTMTPANEKLFARMRDKNQYGICDIIAACGPLIAAGASPALTIARQIDAAQVRLGIERDDFPATILTQLLEKHFRCHSGLLSDDDHATITQQQDIG